MLANAVMPPEQNNMIDDNQQDAVRQFAVNFLRTYGCHIQVNDSVLVADLPAALAAKLGVNNQLQLCWHEKGTSDAEYLTFGMPLFDRMLELASERGQVCNLLCTAGLNVNSIQMILTQTPFQKPQASIPATFRHLCRTVSKFRLLNAQIQMHRQHLIHHQQLLFIFRVAFVSDEKQEMMVPILIDPLTEEANSLIDLHQTVSMVLPTKKIGHNEKRTYQGGEMLPLVKMLQDATLPAESYSIIRCYQRAVAALEEKLNAEFAAYSQQAQQRLNKELLRIDIYYKGLAQEALDPLRKAFRRIATLSVRTQLARAYETQKHFNAQLQKMKRESTHLENVCDMQLQSLENEKQRRINELKAKYKTHVEVLLSSIAALHVPRVEYSLHIQGPATHTTTFFYDVLRDRVLDLVCDCCAQPLEEAYLCECGELVCPDCVHICSQCGHVVCSNCGGTRCHICAAPSCPHCAMQCPLSVGLSTDTVVCPDCAKQYCHLCISWQPIDAANH